MPCVEPPIKHIPAPKDEAILWRYMDLSRFLSLLGTSELHFCRADLFEDKWEGALHMVRVEAERRFLEEAGFKVTSHIADHSKVNVKMFYLNCWHKNNNESAAMWKLYSQSSESIALRTSAGRIRTALQNTTENLYLGDVTYCDYKGMAEYWNTNISNGFLPMFSKRLSFAHEQEVRIARFEITSPKDKFDPNTFWQLQKPCLTSRVDLSALIETVYVSPTSPEWFRDVVAEVMIRYGLPSVDVIRSPLNDGPVY